MSRPIFCSYLEHLLTRTVSDVAGDVKKIHSYAAAILLASTILATMTERMMIIPNTVKVHQ